MSIRPTSFGVGETWTWNIRLRNVANVAVDADSTPTVTVYKNNSATGESVTVTKPSATTGWYQCSFDPAGEAEHDVYSFVENVTIAAVAQAPFQWEVVVLASVGAGGLDAAGVRAAVGLASANMDTQLSGISNKTTNLPSDPADQSLIVAATDAIMTRLGSPAGASIAADIAAGGGGGDATLENQELILAALESTPVSVTGYASLSPTGALLLKEGHTATVTFTSSTSNIVSDLTDARVYLSVREVSGTKMMQVQGTVLVATGLQSVRFVIDAENALKLRKGKHLFDVVAVYGYDEELTPPYTGLQPFTGGTAEVTRLELDL